MPEWPEMENYRTQLSPRICGQSIRGVSVNRPRTINEPVDTFTSQLVGRTVLFLERRGKHLLFHLDDGNRLHLHLMLGGWLAYGPQGPKEDSHFQVIVTFEDGNSIYFGGLRLGYLHRISAKQAAEIMRELGPDPFDPRLSEEAFHKRLAGKRGKLKTTLTDQHFIAGIGNCYSDEICFDAKIHPAVIARSLDAESSTRLYRSMRNILQEAKDAGGYMENPLTPGDIVTGGYNERCRVYDRKGEPCVVCGSEIQFETISGRKMFYCPNCQRKP
ncbi:formamidopyrimidine-DNA glycosylase [Cohnella kolymensis]|uniref:Formamidopyrimidine-DNA glycosylase n=1 Tax=Cohnella kolymensis TaxID=1590652 RepID=A0ABR5A115_9BACL|nr:bifunctional DNA-formamidopyrimidine glycosylase/DNA-(apurinic or apyrimidinic site) lyase [Cohnella kolymensis]KIL34753.1 formamidopyrimidine-DNA glycosylase [Cohnella kolymensis]